MLSDTILKKRTQILALILVVSVLLTATTILAATKFIEAKKGGVIRIARGVCFRVPPNSMEKDDTISADVVLEKDRVCFYFEPDGTTFDPPAQLMIVWPTLARLIHLGVRDLTLYYEGDGSGTKPRMRAWGAKYPIEHFSIYYFRRR
jgi:hypothetical protein